MLRKILISAGSLITVLLFCRAFAFANATETTLTTTVREICTLKLEIAGGGHVEINGTSYTESTEVQVKRHSDITIFALPDENSELLDIICNGKSCLSQMYENTLKLTDVNENLTIEVSFNSVEAQAQTGDNALPLWTYSTVLIAPAFMIYILLKIRYKTSRH